LTYGLRGLSYFYLEIECAAKDLHSGVYGDSVHEAMTDLISLMSKLVDNKGNILIPGIMDDVALSPVMRKVYIIKLNSIAFNSEPKSALNDLFMATKSIL